MMIVFNVAFRVRMLLLKHEVTCRIYEDTFGLCDCKILTSNAHGAKTGHTEPTYTNGQHTHMSVHVITLEHRTYCVYHLLCR
jgi:hypothetical protein